MGYMRHHAIVVTSGTRRLSLAHDKAEEIFPYVSPISPEGVNGYQSFFIPPDGSKEWWDESDRGDASRDKFVGYLRYLPVAWVEVQFNDDGGNTRVTRDSDHEEEAETCPV